MRTYDAMGFGKSPKICSWNIGAGENRGGKKLTVVEKIWSIIIDVIAIVAETFTIDENELMEQIIRDNGSGAEVRG